MVSINGKTKISTLFTLEAEYALSGLTRNTRTEVLLLSEHENKLPFIFNARGNSQFFAAYKSSLNFTKNIFSVSLNYEHIDPDYKTLGAYFFNNDLENITLAPALRLLKGKLNLSVNSGFQHNNLDKTKFSTNQRFITSGNISYAPTQKLMLNAVYSNFTSYTSIRPVTDPYYQRSPADTLNFYQLSQNGNASATYNFGKNNLRHTLMLVGTYQVSNQKQGNTTAPPMTVLNGNLSYNLSFIKSKLSAGLTYNYNEIKNFLNTTTYMGPGITLGKGFMKNTLRFSLANIFNQSFTNSDVTALVLSERASISYSPKGNSKYGKPTVSLNAMYTNKFKTTQQVKGFQEFTGTVNLSYSF